MNKKFMVVFAAPLALIFSVYIIGGNLLNTPSPPLEETLLVSQEEPISMQISTEETESTAEVRQFFSTGGFSCIVHVLSSAKGNILIDPGHFSQELAEYIESIGGLDAILITHGHWDNIHYLDEIAAVYPLAEVYIHELDIEFLRDPHLNCSDINGFSLLVDTLPITFQWGIAEIGGYTFEIIHSPGHTCGSCMFYFEEENILFGGDTIMATLVGSAAHPTGNEEERAATIEMFKQRVFPEDMQVFGGHGDATVYAELMKTNVDLQ